MNLVSLCNIRNGKSVSKNLIRNEHWQLVPSPFVYKELCMTSIENEVFEINCLCWNQENMSKLASRLPQTHFSEDSLKIKKELELVTSGLHFLNIFLIKIFILICYLTWRKFHQDTVFTSKVIQSNVFVSSLGI